MTSIAMRDPIPKHRIDAALRELQGLIRERYPDAIFAVSHGVDPEGVYLMTTVDVDDTDEVFEVVVARLLEIQIEDRLPIYVIPTRPLAPIVDDFRSGASPRRPQLLPLG
jgi:hypothetical protein